MMPGKISWLTRTPFFNGLKDRISTLGDHSSSNTVAAPAQIASKPQCLPPTTKATNKSSQDHQFRHNQIETWQNRQLCGSASCHLLGINLHRLKRKSPSRESLERMVRTLGVIEA
jgi:hypothetical protein